MTVPKIHTKSQKSKIEGNENFFFRLICLKLKLEKVLAKIWENIFLSSFFYLFCAFKQLLKGFQIGYKLLFRPGFEKTAIFISDAHFIHRWKALQKLYGKNIRAFLLKLIFMEKNQKNTFLKFLIS